jgi:hypothetical protein
MAELDVHRRFPDRGTTAAWWLEVSEVIAQCAMQRARAERQRSSAESMRQQAHAMRARVRIDCREWTRAR